VAEIGGRKNGEGKSVKLGKGSVSSIFIPLRQIINHSHQKWTHPFPILTYPFMPPSPIHPLIPLHSKKRMRRWTMMTGMENGRKTVVFYERENGQIRMRCALFWIVG
jgi:hypothetical protein